MWVRITVNIFKVDNNAGVAVGGYKVHVFRCSDVITLWRIKVAWNRGGDRENRWSIRANLKVNKGYMRLYDKRGISSQQGADTSHTFVVTTGYTLRKK